MKSVKFTNDNDNEDLFNQETKIKSEQFKQKFSITKDTLNEDDIDQILNLMKIENQDDKKFVSKKILKELDKKNVGYINTKDFIEEVLSRRINKKNEDELSEFYKKIYEQLQTKSEDIISRLKRIQNLEWLKQNKIFSENIEKIIRTIIERRLYDLDSKLIKEKKEDEVGFLLKYSQMEDSNQKEKDYSTIRRKSKKYGNLPNNENNEILKTQTLNTKRSSSNLSNIISPSIIARVYEQMQKISQCDFNIFELDEVLGKKTSIYMATEILNNFSFISNGEIPQKTLKNFITEIVEHYDRINAIYHNDIHAGDVMQTSFVVFIQGNLQEKMKLGELDIFAMLIAAICHDYKHPGTNNLFQINTRSKFAMRYNDISVLENYHLAQSFKVLLKDEFNILKNFTPEEYRIFRRRMIEGILATDMANHQKVLSSTKAKADLYNIVKGKNFEKCFDDENVAKLFEAQQCILDMIIHTADISNAGKPPLISEEWTKRVYEEFFIQGDMEKKLNLPVSNFCDRDTTNINKAMIGFIQFVVGPTIDLLTNLVPQVNAYSEYCRSNLRKHKIWAKNDDRREMKKKIEKEKEEKKKKENEGNEESGK
jgi:hypothetical protein